MKTAQNLVNQSSSALSVVLKNSFWRSCMDRRKNWLFWGLKVTPYFLALLRAPPPFFFPFQFSGNIFCKQTSSDNGISLKKVQMGCGTRFSLKFSNQLFGFSHIFLGPGGVLFEWSPPPPCTSCQSATLPVNIKTFDLTTDTRCGWVRITVVIPNVSVAFEGRECLHTG